MIHFLRSLPGKTLIDRDRICFSSVGRKHFRRYGSDIAAVWSRSSFFFVFHWTPSTRLCLPFSVALHLPSTYHDVLGTHGVRSEECCLARACLKVPRDYTYRANPSRTIFSTLRLSKLLTLWVYFLYLASLAFLFGLKSFPGFLKHQVVDYAYRIALFLSKLATKLRREVGSYSLPSLVRTETMNWLMYSFSSTAGISSIFLSSFFVFKNLSSNLTYRSVFFERCFCFLVLKWILQLSKQKHSLGHFSKRAFFCVQRLSDDVSFSTFIHHQWNFVVRVADWTNDIFSEWNFVVRAPDWLRLKSVRNLFTVIFVDRSQYLWNKKGFRMH